MILSKIFKNNPDGCSVKCVKTTTRTSYKLANYKIGYFVAMTSNCSHTKNINPIVDHIHAQANRLNLKHYFIGYWKDQRTQKEYIDLALHIKSKTRALAIGKKYNQKAIFDCRKFNSIYL